VHLDQELPALCDGDGAVEHDMAEAWQIALRALRLLADEVPDLARRGVALAITGQADGTWLIDEDGDPVAPAMFWLDERASPVVEAWRRQGIEAAVHEITGGALEAGRQSAQLAWLLRHKPALVEGAATVLQAKDWLYFCCTGERATDPAVAISSYGSLRSGSYDERVLELLGLEEISRLLPEMVDGARHFGRMSMTGAAATGLREDMPVVLALPDGLSAALAVGACGGARPVACTVLDGAAVHLQIGQEAEKALPGPGMTILPLVVAGPCATMVHDRDAGLQLGWLQGVMEQLIADIGLIGIAAGDLAALLQTRAAEARPGTLLFHPNAGRRLTPAQLLGLSWHTRLGDLVRAIYEGIAFAARDGHEALGSVPPEIRVAGPPAGDPLLRRILAACLDRPVRRSMRGDPAACGAAMVAAVALGQYGEVREALAHWVEPYLADAEPPDPELAGTYGTLFQTWRRARDGRAEPGSQEQEPATTTA
jgi:erythritol kinase (D-erythritol 1-phosphate-forming)